LFAKALKPVSDDDHDDDYDDDDNDDYDDDDNDDYDDDEMMIMIMSSDLINK
jgi:hypothetical protein